MSLLELIEAAGVVGCGGAGFPTHVKLKGSFECLIVNGAECEPLLRNDRFLMRNMAEDIVETVAAVASELNIPRAVIALKGHYHREVQALRRAVEQQKAGWRSLSWRAFTRRVTSRPWSMRSPDGWCRRRVCLPMWGRW